MARRMARVRADAFHEFLATPESAGFHLSRKTWIKLNRIKTGQTIHYITLGCPYRAYEGDLSHFIRVTANGMN